MKIETPLSDIETKKRALITGITGMDGSHLADFLLTKNYEVFGLVRRLSGENNNNIRHLENNDNVHLLTGDLSDQNSIFRAIKESEPDEIYNLAAQSFVGASWDIPVQTSDITGLGVLRVLESIRECGKEIKFYQASSSEMFGNTTNLQFPGQRQKDVLYNERTTLQPRSPYGVAKLFGHWISRNYRESYGMFNCSGILFNHCGIRRGHEFVTRKITDGVARIFLGLEKTISLGNLEARRDWGWAPSYVEAMYLMLQQEHPDDYVIATGKSRSIKDLLTEAFKCVDIDDWSEYVVQDPRYMRPAEVDVLCGDPSKAKKILGWEQKTSFSEMIQLMVENDIKLLSGS